MIISQEQISTLTKLGALHLDEASQEKILHDLEGIVDYFSILSQVDTSSALLKESETSGLLREDSVHISSIPPISLLSCSPQKIIGNNIVVSSVL